jgi:AAA+ superfamily predicted ATPase
MPRADLLLDLVRAGSRGDQPLFRKVVEAVVAEERSRQHHVLADRLVAHLQANGGGPPSVVGSGRVGPAVEACLEVTPQRGFRDLILPSGLEATCRELIEEQHRADLLRAHNLEPRHRVLLAGPPGNGKTSLAEVLAAELAVPLLVVRYEAVITSYLGETAVRLAKLFEHVRQRRCVLFFDEFDAVGKERGDTHETGEIKRLVSSLLLQVDALPSYVVVVAATNHPELLDRAVWRRFQLRLSLDAPTSGQLGQWLARFEQTLGTKLGRLAASTTKSLAGLSFAELEQFALDVRRRQVLAEGDADLNRIVLERLKQLRDRFSLDPPRRQPSRRDA